MEVNDGEKSILKADKASEKGKKFWNVYLLKCSDGTHYCGVTNNIERRITEHNKGKGAKYTRGRGPVSLLAISKDMAQGKALSLEATVKKGRGAEEKIKRIKEESS